MIKNLEFINLGSIKPLGWIKEQMNNDLTKGFVGKLDEIVPELIKDDDIYNKDRLSKNFKIKNLGVAEKDVEGSLQLQWWNSETQSNWYDGLIRNSILLDSEEYMPKVKEYIKKILSYQDEDGYLGIYDKDLRYNFDFESGELWAQSTLFRGLLGYYEATKDEKVLNAVIKAVDVTMKSYNKENTKPFKFEQTHGLTIVDTLESLYKITGDEKYIECGIWLYDDYCNNNVTEDDAQLKNLINKEYKLKSHGVHTYEHLRAVIMSAYYGKNSKYKDALQGFLDKVDKCLSPSGGPIGDEWIAENFANPSMTGYEYCSIQELLHSYSELLQKSGDMKWADKIEWILFNAAQGSRHPEKSAIAYLKSDNSYSMKGDFQFKQEHSIHSVQTRYKYSPAHKDAAVCCVPNAGRIYPYFVQNMWMKTDGGIVKTLYGPSKINTIINNNKVEIEEITKYPFENSIKYNIKVSEKCNFNLILRKPSWCKTYHISGDNIKVNEVDNTIVINKMWEKSNTIEIKFDYTIEINKDLLEDKYLSYGPLVFAMELKDKEKCEKKYKLDGFNDMYYELDEDINYDLVLNDEDIKYFEVVENDKFKNIWKNKLKIKGKMFNKKIKEFEDIELIPMGGTILRKVTFNER